MPSLEGLVGGSIVYKSKDDIIYQQNHKYDVFWALNRWDGDPTKDGWYIYEPNGTVSFTLPDRTLVASNP